MACWNLSKDFRKHQQNILSKVKRQVRNWKNIFAIHITGLFFLTHTEFLKINIKIQPNKKKRGGKGGAGR